MAVSTTKLLIVALLGIIAMLLGTFVLTVQVLSLHKKQRQSKQQELNNDQQEPGVASLSQRVDVDTVTAVTSTTATATSTAKPPIASTTIAPSLPTDPANLYLWKGQKHQHNYTSQRRVDSAEYYWNLVKDHLIEWDATLLPLKLSSAAAKRRNRRRAATTTADISSALTKAATMGHAPAQHYYAVAVASGIWPYSDNTSIVKDDFWTTDSDMHTAYLYWHMAAMDGNIEAAQALGYRLEHDSSCEAAIPYKAAAAHGIIDQLESHVHSRAKIMPPMDRHMLPEIYTHGGTSSQLALDNKPNELPEAIQYYHIRATATAPDRTAATSLGQMYHYGIRGVEMNSTKALFYYDIAANAGDWESAGQAGKFHVWSLGMEPTERNLLKAKKYFEIGAPFGLEDCRKRFRDFLTKKATSNSMKNPGITLCDLPSINGMGLLYLFGIPTIFDVDVEKAKEYFILARDMGNMDASYNLAMLRLGWKHAWKDDESSTTSSSGFTDASELSNVPDFMKAPSLTESDYRFAKEELIKAASEGHLQASHRLAMMFHHGVKLPGKQKPTIMPDCDKAMKQYQWILDSASIPWSQRTRLAYTQYMQGNLEGSLRNYLMAAETGHSLSQVNAAFLFERGTCLGLSPHNCRKASLRLWKAAAQSGNAEAAIRVGDFYYYGSSETLPFRWLQPLLFPEKLLLPFLFETFDVFHQWIRVQVFGHAVKVMECPIEENGQCMLPMDRADFTKAAEYYRMASKKHKSRRAHFNLGFMFEWGLGVKQDFHLAKRHYDLAQSSNKSHGEADFVVSLALFSMRLHKMYDEAKLWLGGKVGMPIDEVTPPIEQSQINGNTKHVISLMIVILTLWLFQIRARTVR